MEVRSLFPEIPNVGSSAASRARISDNFDNFLTLLTTQLQNQDPLSPISPTEFTTQLVQFSNVEQQINSNKRLEQLVALQVSSHSLAAASYLGTTVEAVGDFAPLEGGEAQYTYTLATAAEDSTIEIYDTKGARVFSAEGQTDAGKHSFVWDGRDKSGLALPDGTYRIAVVAGDNDGPVDTSTTIAGKVTRVNMTADGLSLSLGVLSVPLSRLIEVRQTPPPPPPAAPDP